MRSRRSRMRHDEAEANAVCPAHCEYFCKYYWGALTLRITRRMTRLCAPSKHSLCPRILKLR